MTTDPVAAAPSEPRIVIHSRGARLVALLWLGAGGLLLLATVFLLVSQRRIAYDLPAGLVCVAVGAWLWRRRVEFDEAGVIIVAGSRRRRLYWSTIDGVGIVPGPVWRTAVGLELETGATVALPPTWGASRRTRQALADQLPALIQGHRVPVRWHE